LHINKSNSELITDKALKKNGMIKPSTSLKPNKIGMHSNKMTRKEFKSQHYQKAFDKFQEFKKEQEIARK